MERNATIKNSKKIVLELQIFVDELQHSHMELSQTDICPKRKIHFCLFVCLSVCLQIL